MQEFLEKIIDKQGQIPFSRYMAETLYHPQYGYYNRQGTIFGPDGDFYTSPVLSSLFGIVITRQLKEMWELMGRGTFTLVEYGAGNGKLCRDILEEVEKDPAFSASFHYLVVERSETFLRQYKESLPQNVKCFAADDELQPFRGCILSNELFDNFPVEVICKKNGQVKQLFIGFENQFVEIWNEPAESLAQQLAWFPLTLNEDARTEWSLSVVDWFACVSRQMTEGFILSFDYGYTRNELSSRSADGNIQCYRKHQRTGNPLTGPGQQDITASVDFSLLQKSGESAGIHTLGLTSQYHFLHAAGICNELVSIKATPNNIRMLKLLLVEMGNSIKVLAQRKGLTALQLQGFRLAA